MTRTYKRRNYLINPGFQLRFLAYVAVAVLVCLTTMYLSNSIYFNSLTSQGQEIGLDPSHPYYELIAEQRALLTRTYLGVSVAMFALLMWSGLLLSHHIAGPIYHICRVIREVTEDETSSARVHLRKRDFFKEVETAVNSMIDQYQNSLERQTTKGLLYANDVKSVKALAGARILVVEDNELNMELLIELLVSNGVAVESATNGQEALDILLEDSGFDGVLMDGQMPVMDGYEATRQIRQISGFAGLPVVGMTANLIAEHQQQMFDAGMNAYVSKPIDVSEMFHTLAEWVVPRNAVYAQDAGLRYNDASSTSAPEIPGLDTVGALARTQQNLELYNRLLERFVSRQQNFEQEFRQLLANDGETAASRLAHSLVGVAGNIGATSVQQLARTLDTHCKSEDYDAIADTLAKLSATLTATIEQIQVYLAASPTNLSGGGSHADIETLKQLIEDSDVSARDNIEVLINQSKEPVLDQLNAIKQALAEYDFESALKLVRQLDESERGENKD